MKILCGTDIIEIERIKESIHHIGEPFIQKVYTKEEIAYCEKRGKQKYQHYAVRFAAKEAVFKAVSELLDDKYDLGWQNIEILNNDKQKPQVSFLGICLKKIESIDISLSHCKEYATANVVVVVK